MALDQIRTTCLLCHFQLITDRKNLLPYLDGNELGTNSFSWSQRDIYNFNVMLYSFNVSFILEHAKKGRVLSQAA